MRKLLNTIFVTQPDSYLYLDGGNIGISVDRQTVGKVPLLNIEGIVTFGRSGASPALIHDCLINNREITFLAPSGQFLGRVTGTTNGNVVLRKTQYRCSEDVVESGKLAQTFIIGKIYNQRWILERAIRDHQLVVDQERLRSVINQLKQAISELEQTTDLDRIRGLEGNAAANYYGVFDELILQQTNDFKFAGRTRRPPMDRTNALLSFAYTMLAHECSSALEMVGLDPYVGFMHQDRPGRTSLALDLMEELRGVYADRFVLKLINKRLLKATDFLVAPSGAVTLKDEPRKLFLSQWQQRKQETILHPFLNEKINWGLMPYVQAMLLARYLRGDLDAYPMLLWK